MDWPQSPDLPAISKYKAKKAVFLNMRLLTFIVADGVIPKLSILADPENGRNNKNYVLKINGLLSI